MALCTALWISLLPNAATLLHFWTSPGISGPSLAIFVLTGWFIVFSLNLLFLIVGGVPFRGSSYRWWCAGVLLTAVVLGYFSYSAGTHFDKVMFASLIGTHSGEAVELLGWRMASWVLIVGIFPAILLLRTRVRTEPLGPVQVMRSSAVAIIPLLLTLLLVYSQYQVFASAARNRAITFHTVAPLNLLASASSYGYGLYRTKRGVDSVGLDAKVAHFEPKPRLLVVVLGETARAQNQQVNGYQRATNERMISAGVVNFPFTESCGTATALSVPCLFSGLRRDDYSLFKAQQRETLLDIVKRSGAEVLWLDNDGGCKGVCDRVETIDLTSSADPTWCREAGNCFDEILLEGLENRLANRQRDLLLVLHLKGSHGPAYYKRYPDRFERFKPTCKSKELASCTTEEIVNAYDNTLVYTDYVLGRLTEILRRLQTRFGSVLFYVSDHGESLGEKGLFLHGLPYAIAPQEQTRVPMFVWFSPAFLKSEKWPEGCETKQSKPGASHDNVYHTFLGLMEIETEEYKRELDLFRACEEAEQQISLRMTNRKEQ